MSTVMVSDSGVHAVVVADEIPQVGEVPDPEVVPRAKARSFPASYKKRILSEYEALPREQRGAFLRREGLYSTLIRKWKNQADRDTEAALVDRPRGPKPSDESTRQIAGLQAQVARLEAELADARRIAEVQGKLFALLDDLSRRAPRAGKSNP